MNIVRLCRVQRMEEDHEDFDHFPSSNIENNRKSRCPITGRDRKYYSVKELLQLESEIKLQFLQGLLKDRKGSNVMRMLIAKHRKNEQCEKFFKERHQDTRKELDEFEQQIRNSGRSLTQITAKEKERFQQIHADHEQTMLLFTSSQKLATEYSAEFDKASEICGYLREKDVERFQDHRTVERAEKKLRETGDGDGLQLLQDGIYEKDGRSAIAREDLREVAIKFRDCEQIVKRFLFNRVVAPKARNMDFKAEFKNWEKLYDVQLNVEIENERRKAKREDCLREILEMQYQVHFNLSQLIGAGKDYDKSHRVVEREDLHETLNRQLHHSRNNAARRSSFCGARAGGQEDLRGGSDTNTATRGNENDLQHAGKTATAADGESRAGPTTGHLRAEVEAGDHFSRNMAGAVEGQHQDPRITCTTRTPTTALLDEVENEEHGDICTTRNASNPKTRVVHLGRHDEHQKAREVLTKVLSEDRSQREVITNLSRTVSEHGEGEKKLEAERQLAEIFRTRLNHSYDVAAAFSAEAEQQGEGRPNTTDKNAGEEEHQPMSTRTSPRGLCGKNIKFQSDKVYVEHIMEKLKPFFPPGMPLPENFRLGGPPRGAPRAEWSTSIQDYARLEGPRSPSGQVTWGAATAAATASATSTSSSSSVSSSEVNKKKPLLDRRNTTSSMPAKPRSSAAGRGVLPPASSTSGVPSSSTSVNKFAASYSIAEDGEETMSASRIAEILREGEHEEHDVFYLDEDADEEDEEDVREFLMRASGGGGSSSSSRNYSSRASRIGGGGMNLFPASRTAATSAFSSTSSCSGSASCSSNANDENAAATTAGSNDLLGGAGVPSRGPGTTSTGSALSSRKMKGRLNNQVERLLPPDSDEDDSTDEDAKNHGVEEEDECRRFILEDEFEYNNDVCNAQEQLDFVNDVLRSGCTIPELSDDEGGDTEIHVEDYIQPSRPTSSTLMLNSGEEKAGPDKNSKPQSTAPSSKKHKKGKK
ncbi:unnamed protein product [Amoebophrya sp. A120]|nr:unnamed protein product [Amoebophrya sp. A120]|eukprot:GSA120T00014232001.1